MIHYIVVVYTASCIACSTCGTLVYTTTYYILHVLLHTACSNALHTYIMLVVIHHVHDVVVVMHAHHHYMVHLPVAVHYMYMGVLHATSSPTLGIGPVINRALPS